MTIQNDSVTFTPEDVALLSPDAQAGLAERAALTNITPAELLSGIVTDAVALAVTTYNVEQMAALKDLGAKLLKLTPQTRSALVAQLDAAVAAGQ